MISTESRTDIGRMTKGDVLVVDDNPDNLRLLTGILTEKGYKIRPAPSGSLALTSVQSTLPDLILLDIKMPGMDGYEVCRRLKADERTMDVPVLFISALTEVKDKIKGFSVGGVDYITKPFQHEEVLARVKTHVSLARMHKRLEQARNELEDRVRERTAELAQANEALRQSERKLAIRNRIATIFLTVPDEEMYGEILQVILEVIKSKYGIFGYINEDGAFVCPSMTRDIWDQCRVSDKDIVFPREKWGGIWGRALIEKKTLCSNEPFRVPEGHIPITRALAVPIIHQEEVIGNLLVANKGIDYDDNDQALLETIAGHISPILSARLQRDRQESARKLAEAREKHLNQVLRAVRNINQLIVQEKDRGRLLEKACAILLETRFYSHAWIILTDASGKPTATSQAGLGESFSELVRQIEHGEPPYCVRKALKQPDVLFIKNTGLTCDGCPLPDECHDRGAAIVRLEHGGKVFGFLTIAFPMELVLDEKEKSLLLELAGDIAFALYNYEQEKRKARMEADLTRRAMAMDYATDTIVITDTKGTITYVNPAFEKITGYTRKEALGENPRVLKSGKQDEAFYRHLWQTISGGKTWTGQFINKKKDGSHYTEEATISPVFSPTGEIVNYVAVKRDITNKISLENQLRQAQKMEAIGTLAGGIAHDFNNILGVIIGRAELSQLDLSKNDPAYQNIIEVVKAGSRAKDLVKQILAFSRQAKQERRLIQPGIIIKEALKMLRSSLPSTIEIRQNIAAESGVILADPTQIHQILMNLCTNAYHAMEKTGGVLTVSLAAIEFDPSGTDRETELAPGKYLQLMVSDTGYGIESHIMERIFDPYFTTKKPGEGTGLGLAVVHGIVNSHGGSILVESEIGKGTTFRVLLPKSEDAGKTTEIEDYIPIPPGNERILFVDDEKDLADTTRMMLERLGYQVTVRTSSVEALELFRTQPGAFDLVITDLTMPIMTGADLAKELMRIRPDIPILLCTGFSELISEEKARHMGIKEFVMKPIVMRDMAEIIRKVIDQAD